MLKIKYDIQKIGVTTSPIGLLENQTRLNKLKHHKQYLIKFKHIEVRKCFIMLINDDTSSRTGV